MSTTSSRDSLGRPLAVMVPANSEQREQLMGLFVTRVLPDAPTLLSDDEIQWQTKWRGLKKARKDRFLAEFKVEVIEMLGMKTRAEITAARDWVPDEFVALTEDDDSRYGSDSYFDRAKAKGD